MNHSIVDHRSGVAQNEFARWAYRSGVHRGEDFVINNFLAADKRTLEAGTGGGRMLLNLQSRGFSDLHGFDYLPDLIEIARARDETHTIEYRVLDAVRLDYQDNSFDQLLYLQQVLCFLATESDQCRAVDEAFRVLRPGGTLVACVLADRTRRQSWIQRRVISYLRCVRTLTRSRRSVQYSPWLRRDSKLRFGALLDRGPYVYWFEEKEAVALFQRAGFEVVSLGSDAQVAAGRFLETVDDLQHAPFRGGLYLVCRKPGA